MGIRKIKVFPDNPNDICEYVKNAKMIVNKIIETDFAFIIVATFS